VTPKKQTRPVAEAGLLFGPLQGLASARRAVQIRRSGRHSEDLTTSGAMAPQGHHREIEARAAGMRLFDRALHDAMRTGHRAINIQPNRNIGMPMIGHSQRGGIKLKQQLVDLMGGAHGAFLSWVLEQAGD
jgi:hypothetical protein